MWLLFPLFTLLGYALLAVGSRDPAVRQPTRWLAVPLLLLALVAAVSLVAAGAGLVQVGSSAPLWYVLALGGLMGVVGSAVTRQPA
jgi:FtsH-binding integral membrane protein